eukprot:1052871-Ditylum_brightwellii.AAC.1
MVISTIKYDQDGRPKRVKCHIVALGNPDPHAWSSEEVFAPVMSMPELQVFVKAKLPANKQYVIRPPAGCPNSKPNTYWLLKRTLYGLKQSPRH